MNKTEIQAWVKLAFHDEETATLIRDHAGHPDMGIYHLHQAAEKLLKAASLVGHSTAPKIHFLDSLFSLVTESWPTLTSLSRPISDLDRFLPLLRYPHGGDILSGDFLTCFESYSVIRTVLLEIIEREAGVDLL